MIRRILFSIFLLAPALHAQVWFSATPQITDGATVTVTSTVIVRYGQIASTCAATYQNCVAGQPSVAGWTTPMTITGTVAKPITITVGLAWAGSDPAPGVIKQLEIQQTASAQTITVNGKSVTIPPIPPPAPTVTASYSLSNCFLDFYSNNTAQIRAGCTAVKQ